MQHVKNVPVPATTRQVVELTTCDICKAAITHGTYEVSEIEVRHKSGESYPESGSGTEIEYDICKVCFTNKVVPFLASLGATPRQTDWDW